MLAATFISTMFYSATYPYIHKVVIENTSNEFIALNQIINCISIIIIGSLWNKYSDKIFKHYDMICILESVCNILLVLYTMYTNNIIEYYLMDTIIFATITRNVICGGVKLRALRYNTEKERECFDNNNNSASAMATIIGSIIAMVLNLDIIAMLWIAILGNTIDNIFYIFIYRQAKDTKTEAGKEE